MPQFKLTKIELEKYKKKHDRFSKYLPTLQLKKMLLQTEVNKAKTEIETATEKMQKQLAIVKTHAALLTHPSATDIEDRLQVEEVLVTTENIAGIDVPTFKDVVFKKVESSAAMEPIWFYDLVSMLRVLKKAFQKVRVAKEKKELLEVELRTVSIRVNLFEKRMIPETEEIIRKIKIFLGDQELSAIGSAKVTKSKLLKKKMRSLENAS